MVITGFIGPHGIKKLQSKNIKVVADEEGTVKEAIERFNRRHPK